MKNMILIIFAAILTSCSGYNIAYIKSGDLQKVSLEMTKEQVTKILGKKYLISKKEIQEQDTIEVISYRNFPYEEELMLFYFKNNKLEKWDREFIPKFNKVE